MAQEQEQMTAQEAELLKYLEDLQSSNPAEYEVLVSQLQAKNGGSADGAPKGGEKVVPEPGFVAKTRSFTRQGAKVFINVCQSYHVDPPGEVEPAPGSSGDELPLRIPLALGPPREDLDKDGSVCTVYDVVFHPSTVQSSLADEAFRNLMLQLTLHQIKQKNGDDLSDDVSFPKVKGNYKGIAPLPQYMRKRGEPTVAQEEVASAAAAATAAPVVGGAKVLVEEIGGGTHSLPAPAYAVEPRRWRDGAAERVSEAEAAADAAGGPCAGVECLSVKLHLPEVEASEVRVELTSDELRLSVEGKYKVSVLLPKSVELRPLCARFETRRRILNVALRCEVDAGSCNLDGPNPESEAERREREARLRAKQRLARARREKASAAADKTAGRAAAVAEAEAEGAAVAAPVAETETEGGDDEEGAVPGGGKETETRLQLAPALVLTNSIAEELED